MKTAYIILAHKLPDQLVRLVRRLNSEDNFFFIHIDKQTNDNVYKQIFDQLNIYPNVHFIKRYISKWGREGGVKATLQAIKDICESTIEFSHVILISGQCYPIKSNETIGDFLKINTGLSFLDYHLVEGPETKIREERLIYWNYFFGKYHIVFPRENMFNSRLLKKVGNFVAKILPFRRKIPLGYDPYWGYAFWVISYPCCLYINDFMRTNQGFLKFFSRVFIPDEFFFQILLLNSPCKDQIINNCLTYVDFTKRKSHHPAILGVQDFPKFMASDKLFARKFDPIQDSEVLDMIDEYLDGSKINKLSPLGDGNEDCIVA